MTMAFRLLAGSCDGGPCPTFRRDDRTGDVEVQGYVTESSVPLPPGEDVVLIPAEAWARLLSRLPLSMLLRALLTPVRRPAVRAQQPQFQ
jgi:hypothetical protein